VSHKLILGSGFASLPLLVLAFIGRLEESDPLIACGGLAGLLFIATGLILTFDLGGGGTSYEQWMARRNPGAARGYARKLGLGYLFAGSAFLLTAVTWLFYLG
jgi:hypothetical protein